MNQQIYSEDCYLPKLYFRFKKELQSSAVIEHLAMFWDNPPPELISTKKAGGIW